MVLIMYSNRPLLDQSFCSPMFSCNPRLGYALYKNAGVSHCRLKLLERVTSIPSLTFRLNHKMIPTSGIETACYDNDTGDHEYTDDRHG